MATCDEIVVGEGFLELPDMYLYDAVQPPRKLDPVELGCKVEFWMFLHAALQHHTPPTTAQSDKALLETTETSSPLTPDRNPSKNSLQPRIGTTQKFKTLTADRALLTALTASWACMSLPLSVGKHLRMPSRSQGSSKLRLFRLRIIITPACIQVTA
ncbi:hypothetical protein HYFRA_00005118 [Hymenoscyphus fraxineus]|uniref:Uncharacterized protein n=1 Tax=Hymenoscyphus fraxineus TaxID=746836 RepID=A0A9N9Q042_9HELO|nr:hypothetical protein HYFRA_00005118 [Hymenoscyphus fraxineus]